MVASMPSVLANCTMAYTPCERRATRLILQHDTTMAEQYLQREQLQIRDLGDLRHLPGPLGGLSFSNFRKGCTSTGFLDRSGLWNLGFHRGFCPAPLHDWSFRLICGIDSRDLLVLSGFTASPWFCSLFFHLHWFSNNWRFSLLWDHFNGVDFFTRLSVSRKGLDFLQLWLSNSYLFRFPPSGGLRDSLLLSGPDWRLLLLFGLHGDNSIFYNLDLFSRIRLILRGAPLRLGIPASRRLSDSRWCRSFAFLPRSFDWSGDDRCVTGVCGIGHKRFYSGSRVQVGDFDGSRFQVRLGFRGSASGCGVLQTASTSVRHSCCSGFWVGGVRRSTLMSSTGSTSCLGVVIIFFTPVRHSWVSGFCFGVFKIFPLRSSMGSAFCFGVFIILFTPVRHSGVCGFCLGVVTEVVFKSADSSTAGPSPTTLDS
ncbi:hypothetical protein EYF80_015207 [Liparis tanakae]|uniref:Uncharacterized protein n=1 Tax=Liparis tanakae TaxID=230148 RepID=A0A4Z2I9V8_9TELE|nr:hypothetical protein EYF80_015207 [Liparis tanakae]